MTDAAKLAFGSKWSEVEDNELGDIGSIALGATGCDVYKDVGDLAHDLYNWEWSWRHVGETGMDAVGVLPLFGVLKNFRRAKKVDLDDGLKFIDEAADARRLDAPNSAAIARKLEAESFISRHAIDMTNAPASSARNALGFQRNGPWFWRQLRNQKPEMFSAENLRRIKNRQAPIVDEAWVRHNPQHADFLGDKLIHHHIDQGRFASGLPESIHQQLFDLLHNRTTR